MKAFIYLWIDVKRNRLYIGSHVGSETDGYICSSIPMLRAYKKRPNDFHRYILFRIKTNEYQDVLDEEEKWLQNIPNEQLGKRYYNLKKDTGGWILSEEYASSGQKLRQSQLRRWQDIEYQEDFKSMMLENWKSEEFRKKQKEGYDQESRDIISKSARKSWQESRESRLDKTFRRQDVQEKRKNNLVEKIQNSIWCNNGTVSKRLKQIPDGWSLGRLPYSNPGSKGKTWCNNGVVSRLFNEIPEGWIKGRL